MDRKKISYIKNEVLKNGRQIIVLTDEAIVKVIRGFNNCLTMREVEKLNSSLVFPIHRTTANRIIAAGHEFDDLVANKVYLIHNCNLV